MACALNLPAAPALLSTDQEALSNALALAQSSLATNPPAKTRRGLEAISDFATRALLTTNSAQRTKLVRQISEINAALENNRRPPVPRSIDLTQLPFAHYRYISGRVGLGNTRATNLEPHADDWDLGQVDPISSSFWKPPTNIASQNLSVGFGRRDRPRFEETIWTYARPKDGYGAHAGFEAQNGSQRIKIKFGELHSEPFTARIFHTLGYNVDACDYSPGLKVKYDRRIFTEFNSRKPVNTRISVLGMLPVWTIRFQPEHDPFQSIAAAVLKDGTTLSRAELRAALLATAVDTNVESRIEYLITTPANVQLRDPHEQNIGPWDFGQLGHEHLRELRGAGLLAAWLGWFDCRFENTRLRVVTGENGLELKHVFSDVGGGLGKSVGWSGWRGEVPGEFSDSFTEPEVFQGKGRMTIPFRIVNFRPIEPTPAFREMTMDDARWMARRIAQLTEQQIVEALRASGFDDVNVELYRRKLLDRREKMLRDLRLP